MVSKMVSKMVSMMISMMMMPMNMSMMIKTRIQTDDHHDDDDDEDDELDDDDDERRLASPDCLDGTTRQRRRLFAQELENVLSLFAVLEYGIPVPVFQYRYYICQEIEYVLSGARKFKNHLHRSWNMYYLCRS